MNQKKYSPLTMAVSILVLLGLGACEKLLDDFEFEKKTSQLVVNAILNPDSVINIHVSSSKTYNPPGAFKQIENAVIQLFENNNSLGQLNSTGHGYYSLPDTYPQENATYKVVVTADGFESVWAETTIPRKLENPQVSQRIQTTTYEYGHTSTKMEYNITYRVPHTLPVFCSTSISSQKQGTRPDYVCEEQEAAWHDGYYYERDTCYYVVEDSLATRTEQISLYSNSSLIKFTKSWGEYQTTDFDEIYSVEKIYFSSQNYRSNQLSLPLRIDYYNLFNNNNNEITIWTDSFDEVLYNFMYSLAKRYEVDGALFAEKVSVYSNVNSGLGIFGSVNSTGHVIRYDDDFLESLGADN